MSVPEWIAKYWIQWAFGIVTGMDAMRMYALAQAKGLKDKYFSEYVG